MTAFLARLADGGFSIGIEAPLDNDWMSAGDQARRERGLVSVDAPLSL